MRHNLNHVTVAALSLSALLGTPAVAQTTQSGEGDLNTVLLIIILIALVIIGIFAVLTRTEIGRTIGHHFAALQERFAIFEEKVAPDAPEGEARSVESWMGRIQNDHKGLMAALRAHLVETEKAKARVTELEGELAEVRAKQTGLTEELEEAKTSLTTTESERKREHDRRVELEKEISAATTAIEAEKRKRHEDTERLQSEVSELKREMRELVHEHRATDRVVQRVVKHHTDINGSGKQAVT